MHQDNPRDQIVAILQAAQGHLLNIIHYRYSDDKLLEVLNLLNKVQLLLKNMPKGKWPKGVVRKTRV